MSAKTICDGIARVAAMDVAGREEWFDEEERDQNAERKADIIRAALSQENGGDDE